MSQQHSSSLLRFQQYSPAQPFARPHEGVKVMPSPAQPTEKNAIQRNATPLTHGPHQPHQPHLPLPVSQFGPMPTIPDEHWKLILEVTDERAYDLIYYIEDKVPNRPIDLAYSKVRCLLFAIRGLAERIKPLVTLSATPVPASPVSAPLALAPLAPAPLALALAPPSPKGKPRKGVIQYYRCLRFNHIASTCKKPQIYSYYKAEGHTGSVCKV